MLLLWILKFIENKVIAIQHLAYFTVKRSPAMH